MTEESKEGTVSPRQPTPGDDDDVGTLRLAKVAN